jgi:hypothetical protein
MESPHCKLGPGKCRDCDRAEALEWLEGVLAPGPARVTIPSGWTMDHPWWPSSQMTDLQASHYDNVLQSVLALEKHEIQRIYEFLHKIGHTIYRE